MRRIISIAFVLVTVYSSAQLSMQLDFGTYVGTKESGEEDFITDYCISVGNTFHQQFHLLAGIKGQHIKYKTTLFEDTSNDAFNHDLFCTSLFISSKYCIPIIKLKKKDYIGLEPEIRGYFNFLAPRKLDYRVQSPEPPYETLEIVTRKAPYKLQLAYGYGANLIYSPCSNNVRLGLKLEWSNLDPFVAVRQFEDFTSPHFLHVGIFLTLIDIL